MKGVSSRIYKTITMTDKQIKYAFIAILKQKRLPLGNLLVIV